MIKLKLEVDSIQKYCNNKILLSDIYLNSESGKIIGLLGKNGSGKSTLLKIIYGIERAENKFVRINGIVKFKNSQLIKEISYLDQKHFIPNHFSVKKAILLSIEKHSHFSFYDDEIIQEIKKLKIRQLSLGQLRYLEIKIILYNNSKFLLLDEPYSGLSPLQIEKINKIIIENSFKKGIIMTDHNYNEIIKIATEIILLKSGKTILINEINELKEHGYIT